MQVIPIKSKTDMQVRPIPGGVKYTNKNTIGYDLMGGPYDHAAFIAATMGGKTTAMVHTIPETIGPDTVIHIFSHTGDSDDAWNFLEKKFEDTDVRLVKYKSVDELPGLILELKEELTELKQMEEERKQLEELVKEHQQRKKKWVERIDVDNPDHLLTLKIKIEKPKKQMYYPKHLIIFDDISREIQRNPYFAELLKESRHFKCKVYCSTQNINDVQPQCWLQLKKILLFGGIGCEKLVHLFDTIDLGLTKKKFFDMYDMATNNKEYSFLYIDIPKKQFREKFDYLIKVDK